MQKYNINKTVKEVLDFQDKIESAKYLKTLVKLDPTKKYKEESK